MADAAASLWSGVRPMPRLATLLAPIGRASAWNPIRPSVAHHTRGRVDTDYPYDPLLDRFWDVRNRTKIAGLPCLWCLIYRPRIIEMVTYFPLRVTPVPQNGSNPWARLHSQR